MSYQITPEPVNTRWDDSRLGWLGLAWHEKFGPASLSKLHKYYGFEGGAKAWEAGQKQLTEAQINPKFIKDFITWRQNIKLNDLRQQLDSQGINFISPWDKVYPAPLKQIHTAPGALFWRGSPMDSRPWVSVVGTRKMSTYGKRACESIITGLVARGAGIVSGLALGIDGTAHKSALEQQGITIAVLGSGVDDESIYPSAHQKLAEQILLTGGAIISEFPPKTQGLPHHFPQRNRIIAALGRATVVVEAGLKSGSVLTAKNALEAGRDVFAVPGPITSETSRGTHELIRQGASICESAADILNQGTAAQNTEPPATPSLGRELSTDERNILDLCRTATHVDDLARHINTSAASVASTCMSLELIDALHDTGGQTYELTQIGRQLLNMV
ncbi:DNA-protecting protein DprA [Candidatus Uhrbacteria bacterium]|nr:DNA-protecting protein DprA [Candidatus Uhrbacteria bacterium]